MFPYLHCEYNQQLCRLSLTKHYLLLLLLSTIVLFNTSTEYTENANIAKIK